MMDVLAWLWWAVSSLMGVAWTLVWFLVGGWVSTLAQIVVVVLVLFGLRYGWRRAPIEAWAGAQRLGRFAWAWLGMRQPHAAGAVPATRTEVRTEIVRVRRREVGDTNISTLMTLGVLAGLVVVAALG